MQYIRSVKGGPRETSVGGGNLVAPYINKFWESSNGKKKINLDPRRLRGEPCGGTHMVTRLARM